MSSLTLSGLGHTPDEGHDQARCLPCHFVYEERHAFKHLPAGLAAKLLSDHKAIMAQVAQGTLPLLLLQAHADLEDRTFPTWLPAAMSASLLRDHREYERILLGKGE